MACDAEEAKVNDGEEGGSDQIVIDTPKLSQMHFFKPKPFFSALTLVTLVFRE